MEAIGVERDDLIQRASYMVGNPSAWDSYDDGASEIIRSLLAALSPASPARPELTVWYGKMPESNGRENWTAVLRRVNPTDKWDQGFCFARSEYPGRVLYEADRVRWIIGERAERPDILAYDADAHSGYVEPASPARTPMGEPVAWIERQNDGTRYGEPKRWPPSDRARSYAQEMGRTIEPLYAAASPARSPMGGPQVLKGVGKINGDGWKDTTTIGEVVYVWNAEKPSPYAPGQYPRIWNEGWSASTAQYDFSPASIDEVRALAAPTPMGGDREHSSRCWGRTSFSDEVLHCYCQTAPTPMGGAGWVVSNGNETRWRSWDQGNSIWVDSPEKATRYARREDAELVHAEDEDAWCIKPYHQHDFHPDPKSGIRICADPECRKVERKADRTSVHLEHEAGCLPRGAISGDTNGQTVWLDGFTGGAHRLGIWGGLTLRFVEGDGSEVCRSYVDDALAAPTPMGGEVEALREAASGVADALHDAAHVKTRNLEAAITNLADLKVIAFKAATALREALAASSPSPAQGGMAAPPSVQPVEGK